MSGTCSREGGREGEREGGREGGRERGREGGGREEVKGPPVECALFRTMVHNGVACL